MKKKAPITAFFTLLILISVSGFSQEISSAEQDLTEQGEDAQDLIYIINSFTFNIDGLTRPYALIKKADFIEGEVITGYVNLERYIQNKTQILYNERVLDSVRIEYTTGSALEDGRYPVDLIIHIKDTWNIVAIPRPEYSSNTGFDITIKARDYNFLGTMSPLRLDIGYRYDELGRSFFSLMLDSDIPLRLFNLDWYINFDHDVSYRPDMIFDWYYRNITGLSLDIPFGITTPKVGFDVHFIVNEETDDADKEEYGDFQEGLYISIRPFISLKIPIFKAADYGELTYTPRISAIFNQGIAPWVLSDNRRGPFLNFSHSFDFGRINWINNFQQGYSANVGNTFNYDFFYRNNTEPLSININASGIAHFVFFERLGLSVRLMYRQWFNSYYDSAGDVLRGILDKSIQTDFMISLNLDLPVKVLRARPSQWFNWNTRILDFDVHLGPVADMAYANNNFYFSGGFELVIFPEFFRSLYLRVSTTWDLSNISERTPMELFIGTELHF